MNRDNIITSLLIAVVILISGTAIYCGKPVSSPDTLVLLKTNGMTCQSCSQKITQALTQRTGIKHVTVDVPAGIVEIYFDSHQTSPLNLANTVTNLGFSSTIAYVQPYKVPSCPQPGVGPEAQSQCKNCNKRTIN